MNTLERDDLTQLQQLVTRGAAHLKGDLNEEQIELYDLTFAQANLHAATALRRLAAASSNMLLKDLSAYFSAEIAAEVRYRLGIRPQAYGLSATDIHISAGQADSLLPQNIAELGRALLAQGLPEQPLNESQRMICDTFRKFADDVVKPLAEGIHRQDKLIPDEILQPLREMGCFGLSVPERFGGLKPDDREDSVGMVIVTEELSRGSLGAAGSLITRPEIMARAIMEGGTDAQQARWLPDIAAGDPLCAISVTEPNTGSDVASVALRATRTDGGWLLNGGKTWCTFAGKAGAILVLARTEPDAKPPHKGLSLFVVEKPVHEGHDIEYIQDNGGKMSGRAIATLGYRGMHSFEMFYDDFFVPDDCLIGEEGGRGKGFYFTMRGFMGGRLQTAARACGLMRAAFEDSVSYASDRKVFGQAVAQYPLSLAKIVKMAANIVACRAFTHEVAALMDRGEGAMEASLVKLISCRAAEWVTREALQMYGGMGYAEESPVSRYFADARVLSIFEGAEETLAIRVVGKALVEQGRGA
ncbi:MAG: acyl-CoA dehydrogenase family protein [bacterium]